MSQASWLSVMERDGACGHVQRENSFQSIYFPDEFILATEREREEVSDV